MSITLNRVGWENGTLVTPAKVNIDGAIYDVTPEQYTGETPLSAENLKAMENNTENAINETYNLLDGQAIKAKVIVKGIQVQGNTDTTSNIDYSSIEGNIITSTLIGCVSTSSNKDIQYCIPHIQGDTVGQIEKIKSVRVKNSSAGIIYVSILVLYTTA